MIEQKRPRLNPLQRLLPSGLLASARWLNDHGYPSNLLAHYVARGWLESPARGVYRRPGPALTWQAVVASLQLVEGYYVHVGGRTALVQRGLGHYARAKGSEPICLYGPETLPHWANKLGVVERFETRSDTALASLRLRRDEHGTLRRFPDDAAAEASAAGEFGLTEFKWDTWDWPLLFASEERAILEMLQDVPEHESIYEAYVLLQGRVNLRPQRVETLLRACRSVKAKRLFLALAARHGHAWLKRVDLKGIDLGKGKRALFPGGKLDAEYLITLPADLDEHAR